MTCARQTGVGGTPRGTWLTENPLQRSTAEIEDNINQGRTAFVTAGILMLRGGMPIRVNGAVVGAAGVAGLSKEIDAEIANTAAAALSPSPMTPQRR